MLRKEKVDTPIIILTAKSEINDKLKKVFEDLRAVQEGTAFFITYWNGLMIPTGEEDLFRITITLNTNEWKGA